MELNFNNLLEKAIKQIDFIKSAKRGAAFGTVGAGKSGPMAPKKGKGSKYKRDKNWKKE